MGVLLVPTKPNQRVIPVKRNGPVSPAARGTGGRSAGWLIDEVAACVLKSFRMSLGCLGRTKLELVACDPPRRSPSSSESCLTARAGFSLEP